MTAKTGHIWQSGLLVQNRETPTKNGKPQDVNSRIFFCARCEITATWIYIPEVLLPHFRCLTGKSFDGHKKWGLESFLSRFIILWLTRFSCFAAVEFLETPKRLCRLVSFICCGNSTSKVASLHPVLHWLVSSFIEHGRIHPDLSCWKVY